MIPTYDMGSMPFDGDFELFERGAATRPLTSQLHSENRDAQHYFAARVVDSLVHKYKTGITVPNYPQFRDMDTMFLNSLHGIVNTQRGYEVYDRIKLPKENAAIPEIAVIADQSHAIMERVGAPCAIKLCVTGPYTLASRFTHHSGELFEMLGAALSAYVTANLLRNHDVTTTLVSVDEPVFGVIDDPLLGHGQPGREALHHAWDDVFHSAHGQGVQTALHLHNTGNELFWHIEPIDILESHVPDPLYTTPRTKTLLNRYDKSLKASIATTNFDELIRAAMTAQGVADAELPRKMVAMWAAIRIGSVEPITLIDRIRTMTDRLRRVVAVFGDRVAFAGPECGLRGFPTYESALECLRRVTKASETAQAGDAA